MPEQTRESYYPSFVSLHVPCLWFLLEHKEIGEGYEEEIIMIWYVISIFFFGRMTLKAFLSSCAGYFSRVLSAAFTVYTRTLSQDFSLQPFNRNAIS